MAKKVAIKRANLFRFKHMAIVAGLFGVLGLTLMLASSAAGSAELSLVASDSNLRANEEFEVELRLNTAGEGVNALDTDVVYDPALLEFISVLGNNPPWDLNIDSNTPGNINVVRATSLVSAVNDDTSLVVTLTFRALDTSGAAAISLSDSMVVRTSDNTDIFGVANNTSVTLDNLEPSIFIAQPGNGTLVSGQTTLSFNATDDAGVDRVDVSIDGSVVRSILNPPFNTSFDTTSLSDGPHSLSATAYDVAGNSKVSGSRSFTSDNTSPAVSVASPSSSQVVSGELSIVADASDAEGVDQVDFIVNGSSVHIDSTSPFEYAWNTGSLSDGSYTLRVRATDNAGNVTDSQTVTVTADNSSPSVSITSPSDGQSVSGTVSVAVSAADSSGLARVELLADGAVVDSDSFAPFNFSWNSEASNGDVVLSARATDSAGNVANSSSVTVSVNNLPADVNQDGVVNILDLSSLLAKWQTTAGTGRSDINDDGVVNIFDLSILLSNWGTTL